MSSEIIDYHVRITATKTPMESQQQYVCVRAYVCVSVCVYGVLIIVCMYDRALNIKQAGGQQISDIYTQICSRARCKTHLSV